MRWSCLAVVMVAVVVVVACGKKGGGSDPAAGHALLHEYVAAIQEVATQGSAEGLEPVLAGQAAKGAELRSAGKVSGAFAERHRRLIDVTRAVIAPHGGEAARAKVRAFLAAVEGEKRHPPAGGMAAIAPALVEEVLNLHMLLDGSSDREKARARYLPELGR